MPDPSKIEVEIPSDTAEGLAVQEEVVALMEKYEYSMRDIFAVRLSFEEAITNAIRHGNGNDPAKKVTVHATVSEERLWVQITDQGDGFVPEDVPDPTEDNFIDRDCGRGLMLMRAYLNFFEYSNEGRTITMERERNSPLPILDDD